MIKMVVFDMAGTTVNEDNVVYKTVQKAINMEGFSVSLDQVLTEAAGKEKLQAIKSVLAVYGNVKDETLSNKIFQNFKSMLEEAYESMEIFPQNNALELFDALKQKGILVVLNTGYNAQTANSLISKLGWIKGVHFDGLITASDVTKNRPQPDMILQAMEQFHVQDAQKVIKVGDSVIDIEEGQNAGCKLSIGITTGAHTKSQLENAFPDFIIDDLIDLLEVLHTIN